MTVVPVTNGGAGADDDPLALSLRAGAREAEPAEEDVSGGLQPPYIGPLPRRDQRRCEPLSCFLAPAAACPLASSGGLLSCRGVEFADLPGGTGEVGVIHQRGRFPLFGL